MATFPCAEYVQRLLTSKDGPLSSFNRLLGHRVRNKLAVYLDVRAQTTEECSRTVSHASSLRTNLFSSGLSDGVLRPDIGDREEHRYGAHHAATSTDGLGILTLYNTLKLKNKKFITF